jgi:hypothetical protein
MLGEAGRKQTMSELNMEQELKRYLSKVSADTPSQHPERSPECVSLLALNWEVTGKRPLADEQLSHIKQCPFCRRMLSLTEEHARPRHAYGVKVMQQIAGSLSAIVASTIDRTTQLQRGATRIPALVVVIVISFLAGTIATSFLAGAIGYIAGSAKPKAAAQIYQDENKKLLQEIEALRDKLVKEEEKKEAFKKEYEKLLEKNRAAFPKEKIAPSPSPVPYTDPRVLPTRGEVPHTDSRVLPTTQEVPHTPSLKPRQ